MESLQKAYEITMGSIIVFKESIYFCSLLMAIVIDLLYQILCWAVWILSI